MLNHKGTAALETERLILRKFRIEDTADAFNNFFSDADVAFYMLWDAHTEMSQTEAFIRRFTDAYEKPDFYRWAITLKPCDEVIGAVGFTPGNERDCCADASYLLSKKYWGMGIAAEALKCVLRFGLLEVGMNRIEAFHALKNAASGRVMQKAGMSFEGEMREKYMSHGGFEDCGGYAILRRDLNGLS